MPVSAKQDETSYAIQLDGDIGVSEAAELKQLLFEGVTSGRKLHLDLEKVSQLDVAVMQLLFLLRLKTEQSGRPSIRMSKTAEIALRDAGFGQLVDAGGWNV